MQDRIPELNQVPCDHYFAAMYAQIYYSLKCCYLYDWILPTYMLLLMYAQNCANNREHRTRTRGVAFVPRFNVDGVIGACFRVSTWSEEYSLRITPVVVSTLVADRKTMPCSAAPKKKGRRRPVCKFCMSVRVCAAVVCVLCGLS
jgi:hypothetical protein